MKSEPNVMVAQKFFSRLSVNNFSLRRIGTLVATGAVIFVVAAGQSLRADDPPKSPEDLAREAAIAEWTEKEKAYNYPALFEKAGKEFGVPPEILESISFAETRWEQLKWPPGETVSPENGMPRPYGIMSLWDNDYFGHSLTDAAKLIGQDPQVLKDDAFQNMRGAAALLKQIYDQTPKPDYGKNGEIEGWTYAISKYSGIPERDLNAQHAVDCYDWLSQGFNQYGIELTQKTNLNLGPMKEELAKIKAIARAELEQKMKEHPELSDKDPLVDAMDKKPEIAHASTEKPDITGTKASTNAAPVVAATTTQSNNWIVWMAVLAGTALLLVFLVFRKKDAPAVKK